MLLATHQTEIACGQLSVLFLDECHLLWGDISGYGWSRRKQRVDVEIKSTKQRQTYYGALDYLTKHFVVKEYGAGNEDNTVAFLQYLQSLYPEDTHLVIIWDGVSHHRSKVVQEFLRRLNGGLPAEAWKITCIQLAPNAPEQNPVEDVWLQAKQFVRKYARLCKRFGSVKFLFQLVTHCQTFAFAKAFMYGYCSCPI